VALAWLLEQHSLRPALDLAEPSVPISGNIIGATVPAPELQKAYYYHRHARRHYRRAYRRGYHGGYYPRYYGGYGYYGGYPGYYGGYRRYW